MPNFIITYCMILILSTPTDNDTNCVIQWLNFYNKPFFRLNDEDLMQGKTTFFYNPSNPEESYVEHFLIRVYIKDIKTVWFRKFGFLFEYQNDLGKNNDLMKYMYAEFRSLSNLLFEALNSKKWLYKRKDTVSKLEVLTRAKISGLNIPKTIITTQKEVLKTFFYSNNSKIITKSIGEAKYIVYEKHGFMFNTQLIEDIDSFDTVFSPSLFQEYIDKEIEIRTFYLNEKCYSMAIFSQMDERTKIDFRIYDSEYPNRCVPYKLPNEIENSIIQLMKSINLNTGSLDIIKSSRDGLFYFLEVNPSGQFGMVSFPCNYNLHKKVADYLIEIQ